MFIQKSSKEIETVKRENLKEIDISNRLKFDNHYPYDILRIEIT